MCFEALVNIYVKLLAIQYDNKGGVTCTSGMWETKLTTKIWQRISQPPTSQPHMSTN